MFKFKDRISSSFIQAVSVMIKILKFLFISSICLLFVAGLNFLTFILIVEVWGIENKFIQFSSFLASYIFSLIWSMFFFLEDLDDCFGRKNPWEF